MKNVFALVFLLLLTASGWSVAADNEPRWSADQAKAWYAQQKWVLGSDYLPANAINQFEMWQAATFDPARIDQELGWAQNLGMTSMRVFLHSMLWQQDAAGFQQRIDQFLTIADKHGIKPIFVLFDSCWDPRPKLGPQHAPIPGVHNSGWVQDPGAALASPDEPARMQAYVKGIVGAFAKDPRILAWDVWNEPDNDGGGNYDRFEAKNKVDLVGQWLPHVFAWARSVHPIQPLTSGVWQGGDWSDLAHLSPVARTQLEQSDIITFHNYSWPEEFAKRVKQLTTYGRPLICTEYMARGAGSTIDTVLPLAKKLDVGMINWGFVDGKEQTRLPWDSWDHPYVLSEPPVWHHDLLHADGSPYRQREVDLLKHLSALPRGTATSDAAMP